jgi:hypothetical protein
MTSDFELTDLPDSAPVRPAAMWLRYDSRADGWTAGRRAAFLTHLADNGVVAQAAAAVGKSLASAYALRRRAGGYAFNLGWEAALLLARRRVADELMTVAIQGEKAVWIREEGQTTYTRSNSRIALALLDRVNPATSLNEILAIAQYFDWFLELVDGDDDIWPLFDTALSESDFDARSRVRISLQLSDESADCEGEPAPVDQQTTGDDQPSIEYKSMPPPHDTAAPSLDIPFQPRRNIHPRLRLTPRLRKQMRRHLRTGINRQRHLINPVIFALRDLPAVLGPHIMIMIDGGADGVGLAGRVDEHVLQIPIALRAVWPSEADFGGVAVVLGDDVAVESAADEVDHILPPGQLRAVGAAAQVDLHIFGEEGGKFGLIAGIDTAEISVFELADFFEVGELLGREFGHRYASPKLAGGSPIATTFAAPSLTEWIRQDRRRDRVSAIHQRPAAKV